MKKPSVKKVRKPKSPKKPVHKAVKKGSPKVAAKKADHKKGH